MSRFARALTASLLLLATAGCGGDDGDGDASPDPDRERDPIAAAAGRTIEAGTSRVAHEVLFDGPQGGYGVRGGGDLDFEAWRGRVVYDVSEVPGPFGDEIEVRRDGTLVYVRFSEGAEGVDLPEGKEWLKADVGEGEPPGPEVAAFYQDPAQFLRYLRSGVTEVNDEGTEQVRGVETTIYTAILDLERVLEEGVEDPSADAEQLSAARRELMQLREQVGADVTVTVNIDSDGLVRRLLVTLDIPPGETGVAAAAFTITDLFDFGADVDVEPPPEDRVVERRGGGG